LKFWLLLSIIRYNQQLFGSIQVAQEGFLMAFYSADGRLIGTSLKLVAASQTTSQLSASGNANERPDFIERLVITAASTAAPGTVALLDGSTTIFTFGFVPGAMTALTQTVDLGITAL
jgi:hypothetical protein